MNKKGDGRCDREDWSVGVRELQWRSNMCSQSFFDDRKGVLRDEGTKQTNRIGLDFNKINVHINK